MARKAPLDPVTAYATNVVAGKVVAGLMVRLACQRHLDDLQHGAARGLEWHPEKAIEAIDFFREVLCLPEETDADDDIDDEREPDAGTPFVLQPWQQFIVGSLMGWYASRMTKRGVRKLTRRFRVAFIEGAKGCGKTPLCAGLLIYLLIADGTRGAQMFCAAVTKDQAKIAFADCEKMVKASPHLAAMIDQKVSNLAWLETGNFIRPISSEKRGLDGKRVQAAIIDEEHEHPNGLVYLKVRAGTKGRQNAIILIPTNSGFDKETICGKHHDYSVDVMKGAVQNDAWFAFVCHLDACASCATAGHVQPSDDCSQCDSWQVEGQHWLKANPNLGVSLTWQYLREQVKEATDIPSQRNMVRRLNFCQWTQTGTAWIPTEKWALCAVPVADREPWQASLLGRECYIGIDLSDKIDLSSVVLIFPRPLERAQSVAIEAHDEEGNTVEAVLEIDCAFDVLPYFWMPKNTLQRRAQEDGIPYPEWEQAGYLTVTPGDLVDHDAILAFIIDDVSKRYHVRGIGFDQAGAVAAVTRLQRHFGEELVIEVPQSFRQLSEPSKTFEALIVSGNLSHPDNPVMTMCVGNLAIEENRWREIRPVKISQRKRIDGGVACIDAIKVRQALSHKGDDGDASRYFEQYGLLGPSDGATT